jgi:hypothetical protein
MNINDLFTTDPASILLLVLSSAISFALGRFIVTSRAKKRQREAVRLQELALRNRPPEAESKNKSKRKRQLRQRDNTPGNPGQ